MPVNTAALKTFAPAMRRQLLEAVGRKLDLLLNSQTPDTLSTYSKQIDELHEQEVDNREQLLERVAYTWFNRLAALRYLDARGWHPFGSSVLMPQTESETQPELLKLLRSGSLPGELKNHTNEARLHGLLDGRIPTANAGADPQGEVYRELILAVCRSYHQLLPTLFEGLDAASELLLPDDLLSDGSIAGGFRNQISDSDCDDVEIIGWLYQLYISEKKDQVIGKVVKSEDIPAATQLFTPNWIVKYMVQNSLGAQWLATYPASALKDQMEYYIEPAEQTDEVKAQLAAITPDVLNPEELTLIDPACGSGHILVEAYELLKAIYLERGYQQREIPQLILEKNLYGLDIDERAAQLTSFALMMKGRGDDRRIFERGIQLNVMALVNSDGLDVEALAKVLEHSEYGLKPGVLAELKRLFEHATTLGSLIKVPEELATSLPMLKQLGDGSIQDLFMLEALKHLGLLVQQAEMLAAQYDAMVANPPYMGGKGMNPLLKKFAKDHFPHSKSDLFAISTERFMQFAKPKGFVGLMTPFTWMFLTSYEALRTLLLRTKTLHSLVQPEYHAFFESAFVPVCTFIVQNTHTAEYNACFVRLEEFYGAELQPQKTLEAIANPECGWLYQAKPDDFERVPGSPIAYWVSNVIRDLFVSLDNVETFAEKVTKGIFTGKNDVFLRFWSEIDASNDNWRMYSKGGAYRKWYGNTEHVVRWDKGDGPLHRYEGAGLGASKYYNRPHFVWSKLTSSDASFRHDDDHVFFDDCSPAIIQAEANYELLASLNSTISAFLLKIINPTLNCQSGNVEVLPVTVLPSKTGGEQVAINARRCMNSCRFDWDAYERSWDFQSLPLLSASSKPNPTLESSYTGWIASNKQTIVEMKRLEEENNRLFIDAYGLQDELTPEVPIEQITLTVNPTYRYGGNLTEDELWIRFRQDTIKELLSYATGCMMGRYSLNQAGLILADSRDSQAAQLAAYEEKVGMQLNEIQFKPDPDGIIPVLDGEWFEDDIVARTREFLEVTFPESTVTENLRFIEESLGKDIRKYFCSEFYKDHLQTYKKRPIYWLVQSPKKGFACLIYLHRYTKDTLNQVLNNYFRPYLQKLEARLAQLGLDQLNDDLPARERTAARKEAEKITKVLKECQAWEQDALLPLAQQRIELDLDDGVKVNYLKLQDVLAPIPGLAAKED
jgi:type II restriction/modification system DNA methylase subunit YeeA